MDPEPMADLSEVRRDMGVIMEWRREICSAAMRDLNLIVGCFGGGWGARYLPLDIMRNLIQ